MSVFEQREESGRQTHPSNTREKLWAAASGDYFLLYVLLFLRQELRYFYIRKSTQKIGKKENKEGEGKILKDEYNMSSSLCNIIAGQGHLFEFFINIESCFKL